MQEQKPQSLSVTIGRALMGERRRPSLIVTIGGALIVLAIGIGIWGAITKEGPEATYRRNIGKTSYNAINGARQGTIVGVEQRFGAWCYVVKTESGGTAYHPVDNAVAR